ncbi:hypothetical protein C8R43DRAFT_951252 [Mycena crocata]|nr:hypothetical protein C8R43DRAFT_951252 [Mycena crocata]
MPDTVHIAKEGESVRILGAQVGNGVESHAIWTPTIEKIDAALERWGRSHPTLEARRHIAQITFGSMTQYKTQVNGMPKSVERILIKKQRDFIWAGSKSSPVQREMLQAPIAEGGKNLFDIEARNDAIQLMKLKTYLELDPEKRATWAFASDVRLAKHDLKTSKVQEGVHVNMFTQRWSPKRNELPKHLKDMVNTARKYGIQFDTDNPSRDLRELLPLWHHLGEDPSKRQLNNKPQCKPWGGNDKLCLCEACYDNRRERGCKNPHGCAIAVQTRLRELLPKWDLRVPQRIPPQREVDDTDEVITFVPPREAQTLTEGFRVFTKPQATIAEPEVLAAPVINTPIGEGSLTIYTGGNTSKAGSAEARSAISIWYGPDKPRNTSGRVPNDLEQSTKSAEIVGALLAVQKTAPETTLRIESSRDVTLEMQEDRGWIGSQNRKQTKALARALRQRTGLTLIAVQVEGSHGAMEAARIARSVAGDQEAGTATLDTADQGPVGAKLSQLTQALAYRGIKELRKRVSRKATNNIIGKVQEALKANFAHTPTPATIWKSIRHKDISRSIWTFLWKSMHGAHRVGKFWENIPECQERAVCQHCQETETFEHITLECSKPGQSQIWEFAREFWTRKHHKWPQLSLGSILGCSLATFSDEKNRPIPSTARLYRILMTESLFLI